jgi:hypothetical protein
MEAVPTMRCNCHRSERASGVQPRAACDLHLTKFLTYRTSAWSLGRNLLVDPEVLLDLSHEREQVVNFFCKPGITGAQLF